MMSATNAVLVANKSTWGTRVAFRANLQTINLHSGGVETYNRPACRHTYIYICRNIYIHTYVYTHLFCITHIDGYIQKHNEAMHRAYLETQTLPHMQPKPLQVKVPTLAPYPKLPMLHLLASLWALHCRARCEDSCRLT